MRLSSGIAPVRRFRAEGVDVGLGVDGSASNDSSHMLAEARQALLISRLGSSVAPGIDDMPGMMAAREALELATLGGAAVLGRKDIGALEPGKQADFIAINLNRLDLAGGLHDPVAAAVLCHPVKVDTSVVGGKVIVEEGRLTTLEVEPLIEKHNLAASRLTRGE
jgi:cytosine/adenosine deaminase-related metal-dependent hydrolase